MCQARVLRDGSAARPVLLDVIDGGVIEVGDALPANRAGGVGSKEIVLERAAEAPGLRARSADDPLEHKPPLIEASGDRLDRARRELDGVSELLVFGHEPNQPLSDGVQVREDQTAIIRSESPHEYVVERSVEPFLLPRAIRIGLCAPVEAFEGMRAEQRPDDLDGVLERPLEGLGIGFRDVPIPFHLVVEKPLDRRAVVEIRGMVESRKAEHELHISHPFLWLLNTKQGHEVRSTRHVAELLVVGAGVEAVPEFLVIQSDRTRIEALKYLELQVFGRLLLDRYRAKGSSAHLTLQIPVKVGVSLAVQVSSYLQSVESQIPIEEFKECRQALLAVDYLFAPILLLREVNNGQRNV